MLIKQQKIIRSIADIGSAKLASAFLIDYYKKGIKILQGIKSYEYLVLFLLGIVFTILALIAHWLLFNGVSVKY